MVTGKDERAELPYPSRVLVKHTVECKGAPQNSYKFAQCQKLTVKQSCTIFTYNQELHKIICKEKLSRNKRWNGKGHHSTGKKTAGGHSSKPRQSSLPIIIDRFVGFGKRF